jgi:hypothetical protein
MPKMPKIMPGLNGTVSIFVDGTHIDGLAGIAGGGRRVLDAVRLVHAHRPIAVVHPPVVVRHAQTANGPVGGAATVGDLLMCQ